MRVSSNKLLQNMHSRRHTTRLPSYRHKTFRLNFPEAAYVPKGFKRIRYYGVQATKTLAKVKVAIQAALAKVEGVVKGAVKIIARLTYRQRYEQSTGRDPCICPHGLKMGVWRIWHPSCME